MEFIVKIYQEKSAPLVFRDESDNIEKYMTDITKLLTSTNIVKIQTGNHNILLRPSRVLSVHVKEISKKSTKPVEVKTDIIRDP